MRKIIPAIIVISIFCFMVYNSKTEYYEKSKEFMEIWSKLLPEMVDINPREVLILNPMQNKVYGFNSKDKTAYIRWL